MATAAHSMESRIDAANAHSAGAAQRLVLARRMAGACFPRPFAARDPIALSDAQLAALRGAADSAVEKVMGMIALMIAEAEEDAAAMNDLADIIGAMDRDFFVFAEAPEKYARKAEEEFTFHYPEKYI